MVEGETSDALSMGSRAWNVADGYTKIKILKLLIDLDRFETISLYGVIDIDDYSIPPFEIPRRREDALHRTMTTLKLLIGNVEFAMKKKDRPTLEYYKRRIAQVEDFIGGVSRQEENMITHEKLLVINEEHFKNCFRALQVIKNDINFPINSAGLIFRESDEIDLDKIEEEIIKGG